MEIELVDDRPNRTRGTTMVTCPLGRVSVSEGSIWKKMSIIGQKSGAYTLTVQEDHSLTGSKHKVSPSHQDMKVSEKQKKSGGTTKQHTTKHFTNGIPRTRSMIEPSSYPNGSRAPREIPESLTT